MTTQEKEQEKQTTLNFTFEEFTELDGGWYDRMRLWEDFIMSIPEQSKRYKGNEEIKTLKNYFALKRKIEGVLFDRCDKPEELKNYLNTLPSGKGFIFIRDTLLKIGFLNPVSPN